MKRFARMTFIALLIAFLTACAAPIQISSANAPANTLTSAKDLIKPGDKIGNFLVTTGIDEEVTYVSKLHCPFDAKTSTESCELPVGTKVNVSNSFQGDDYNGKNLDAIWSRHKYEMSIEGKPVNLDAFGSIDTYHPVAGKLRNWNVVIVTDIPGTISIKGSAMLDNETVDMNVVLTFVTR